MKLFSQSSNRSGFSLIEALIVGAVVMTIGLGASQMLQNAFQGQNSVTQTSNFQSLGTLIKLALADSTKCSLSLQKSDGTPVVPSPYNVTTFDLADIPISKVKVGSAVIVDATVPYQGSTISKIFLTQVVAGNPNTLSPYTMKLRVEGTKSAGSVGGSLLTVEVPISVAITTASALSACSTSQSVLMSGPGSQFLAYVSPGCTSATGTGVSSPSGDLFSTTSAFCSQTITTTGSFQTCLMSISAGYCSECNLKNLGAGLYSLTAGACNASGGINGPWGKCQMTCYH